MTFNIHKKDLDIIETAMARIGITISLQQDQAHNTKIKCFFINNPDGSIRWLFPADLKSPEFLRFYYQGNVKSLALKLLYKTFYMLRIQRFIVSGSIELFVSDKEWSSVIQSPVWALFTGTKGVNRKMILWHLQQNKRLFTKVALTDESAKNIERENEVITSLAKECNNKISIPPIHSASSLHLSQTDIQFSTLKRSNGLLNSDAIISWSAQGLKNTSLKEAKWWATACDDLRLTEQASDRRVSKSFLLKMRALKNHLQYAFYPKTSYAHGDFTPWNVALCEDKLHMIDWEFGDAEMPVLNDVFHYIYQSSILVERKSYKEIRKKIDACFSTPKWLSFLSVNKVDLASAEQAYLYKTITYYLSVYTKQPDWHLQVDWLLKTWSEAVSFWLFKDEALTARQLLLLDTAIYMHNKPYAIMKSMIADVKDLKPGSDIDLCMAKQTASELHDYLESHILVRKVNCSRKSFMHQLELHVDNGEMFHIDCIFEFKRKALRYMDRETMLKNTFLNSFGLKQPFAVYDFQYIFLFYALNNAEIPAHYLLHFKEHKNNILDFLKINYNLDIHSYNELASKNESLYKTLREKINDSPCNKGIHKLYHCILYLADSLKSFQSEKGFIITFSGVDGAGKSTIINYSKTFAEKNLRRRVVVLRHRPSVLPILSAIKYGKAGAEAKSVQSLPRTGNNKNLVSSLVRFAYYYLDYFLGQFYVKMKYINRGYVVIYDRYYFDFINDARRSNIMLPQKFVKWLYRFLYKPNINFFLFASPEVILDRKKELDAGVITQLTNEYTRLFKSLSSEYKNSMYLSIENTDLKSTLSTVFHHLKSFYREKNS